MKNRKTNLFLEALRLKNSKIPNVWENQKGDVYMNEQLTKDELGIAATALNAKIRELENELEDWKETGQEKYIEETKIKLQEIRYLQEKLFRMYKFK